MTPPPFPPSTATGHTRLSDKAYAKLRYAITEGQLPAGTHLVELDLVRRLKMGRTPIHDALVRLAGDGLLQNVPNAGFLVRTFTFEDLEMVYEIRRALESLAVRTACRQGFPDSRLIDLEHQCDFMAEAVAQRNPPGVARADFRFHQLLIHLANNPQLEAAIRSSHLQFFTWSRSLPAEMYLDNSRPLADEHRAIVGRLRARDGDGAEQMLQKHFSENQHRFGNIRRLPNAGQFLHRVQVHGEFADGTNPFTEEPSTQ